jgi:hypothetical protein
MEETPRQEAPKDRWGRYLIVDPNGKQRSYTRVTTIAKATSEEGALKAWSNRMVATGLVRRPDLLAAASAKLDDKSGLSKICDQAIDAAGAHSRANLGVALHALTEQLDRGNAVEVLDALKPDIAAYHTTCQKNGIQFVREHIEQVVINDTLEYAGTLDRVVTIGDHRYIADLKTGADLSYAWREIACQLAMYVDAEHAYDWHNGKRLPMPAVDHDRGIVIHLPAGAGQCELYWVNLNDGRYGYQLAMSVRNWRKRSDMYERFQPATIVTDLFPQDPDAPSFDLVEKRREWLRGRISELPAAQQTELKSLWPVGCAIREAGMAEIDAIAKVVALIEGRADLAFGPSDPAVKTRKKPVKK